MSMPVKPVVYILLVTQHLDNVQTAVGPVFWNKIDAYAAMRRFPYDAPYVTVQVVEREIRGDMPTLHTAGQAEQ